MVKSLLDIKNLIPKDHEYRAFWVLVGIFFGMLLEMVGAGLVIPAVGLILAGDNYISTVNEYLFSFNLSFSSAKQLAFISVIALVAVYFCKAVYLTLLAKVQADFVFRIQAEISKALFKQYLEYPLKKHNEKNLSLIHI